MRFIKNRYLKFWYSGGSSLELGINRFLFFSFLLVLVGPSLNSSWTHVPAELWSPVSIYSLLSLSMPTTWATNAIFIFWKISLIFSCVGFMTRYSSIISAAGGPFILSLRYCYGVQRWGDAIVMICLFILALSRCGDSFSCDWLLSHQLKKIKRQIKIPPEEYAWPRQSIKLVFLFVFFLSGVAKIQRTGLNWSNQDPLIYALHYRNRYFMDSPQSFKIPLFMSSFLLKHETICHYLGHMTFTLELISPFAIFFDVAAVAIVFSLYLMLISIYFALGLNFLYTFSMAGMFWLPWLRIFSYFCRFKNLDSK